ncbi:DUF192 domain-containing protein [Candidatus Berkelbacteria bacterium]|nr:DUF192 domain-containing protein [Candidatus Berkelbacteria bacterium]
MKQLILTVVIMSLLFIIASIGINNIAKETGNNVFRAENIEHTTQVIIGDVTFETEVATTDSEQLKGLSGIKNIKPNQAMLFPFSPPTIPSFWMKDMLFNIDIVWISNNKVVEITPNLVAPVKGTSASKLKTYSPSQVVDYVLEIKAGESGKINVGDEVKIIELDGS